MASGGSSAQACLLSPYRRWSARWSHSSSWAATCCLFSSTRIATAAIALALAGTRARSGRGGTACALAAAARAGTGAGARSSFTETPRCVLKPARVPPASGAASCCEAASELVAESCPDELQRRSRCGSDHSRPARGRVGVARRRRAELPQEHARVQRYRGAGHKDDRHRVAARPSRPDRLAAHRAGRRAMGRTGVRVQAGGHHSARRPARPARTAGCGAHRAVPAHLRHLGARRQPGGRRDGIARRAVPRAAAHARPLGCRRRFLDPQVGAAGAARSAAAR